MTETVLPAVDADPGAPGALLAALEHRQRILDEMVAVQRSLARRAPLQDKLDQVTAAAARVLDVELVGIRLVDPSRTDELVVAAGFGLDLSLPVRSPVAGSGVGGRAYRSNETVTVDDYAAEPAALSSYASVGVRSAMAAPVQQLGRAVGSIVVASTRPERRFDDTDRETLRAFADQASIALTEQHLFTAMQQGLVDPLTGLSNRARLNDQLISALDVATRRGSGPAVLFVDLDGFKVVNDALGHGIGDELLVQVGLRLRGAVPAPNLVARFGGDEFAVLMPDVDDLGAATDLAQAVLDALVPRFCAAGHQVTVAASIGIAWDRRRLTAERSAADAAVDMLRCADTAMYRAKAAGRSRYAVFEERMHDELVRRMQQEAEVRTGVDDDEFTAYFQPVVDLATGTCTGAEALVRWQRGVELVPPSAFMDLAEETGLVVPIGRRVLWRACESLAAWARLGRDDLVMAVNLSPRELDSPELVKDVERALDLARVSPAALVIEVTESSLMRDVHAVADRLAALRGLGVRVAIDDFGTGYSSLSRLRWLPIDILKVDRSFVDLVDSEAESRAMLEVVLRLAEALDLTVIVEGVEREAQRQALLDLGCRSGQGYLFSPAVPAGELLGLLSRPLLASPRATA